jgi:hypothetical protein
MTNKRKDIPMSIWKGLLKMLRKTFPISCKVVVRRVPKTWQNAHGTTNFVNNSKFYVYINNNYSADSQIDTLLHEWAHVKAIDEAMQHKGKWGELHGEIYQAWENWDNGV